MFYNKAIRKFSSEIYIYLANMIITVEYNIEIFVMARIFQRYGVNTGNYA